MIFAKQVNGFMYACPRRALCCQVRFIHVVETCGGRAWDADVTNAGRLCNVASRVFKPVSGALLPFTEIFLSTCQQKRINFVNINVL